MLKIQITTDKNIHEVMVLPSVMKSRVEVEELIDYLTVLKDKLWPQLHPQKSALQQFKDEIAQAEASIQQNTKKCQMCGLYLNLCTCEKK